MSRNTIGFHCGPGGNPTGIGDWMRSLNNAGIPFFLKSADHYGMLYEAHAVVQPWNADHTLVYRLSTAGQNDGFDYDVPDYHLSPEASADRHFDRTVSKLPPEMNRALVWHEPVNEVRFEPDPDDPMWGNLHPCEWFGRFGIQYATRSMLAGMRCALFAWAAGNPERDGWEQPSMLAFLRLCAQHPNQVAVALHEYSLDVNNILNGAPYKVGRFQMLFDVCAEHNIAKPTVLITEWGWTLNDAPAPERAIADIDTVMRDYYAAHPQILGAAIWYLGGGWNRLADKVQRIIAPLTTHTLNTEYEGGELPPPPDPQPEPGRGDPRVQYHRRVVLLSGNKGPEWATAIAEASYGRDPGDFTIGKSADDAGIGDLDERTVIVVNPQDWTDSISAFFAQYYPGVDVLEVTAVSPDELKAKIEQYIATGTFDPPIPLDGFDAPVGWEGNQSGPVWPPHYFDANPMGTSYSQGRHTGADLNDNTTHGWDSDRLAPTFAIADGRVTHAGVLGGTWGNTVVIDHGQVGPFARICSRYGHMHDFTVPVGQQVTKGQQIGRIGNAFNQLAYHLHFDIAHGDRLITSPGDWPGSDFGRVVRSYLEPCSFIRLSRPGLVWPEPRAGAVTTAVNFRTGPGSSFAVYSTLAASTAVIVLNELDNYYLVRLTGGEHGWCHKNYINLNPPPAGSARIGLHASADPGDLHGSEAEYAEFRALQGRVVKVLSAHSASSINRLAAENPGAQWIVRAFLHWGGRNITPAQFYNDTIGDTQRAVTTLLSAGVTAANIWIELHNEPNLVEEGWTLSWADGAGFAAWLMDVYGRYRAVLPNVKYLYPGLSPGGNVPGVRQDAAVFLNAGMNAARAMDGVGVHAYWSNPFPMAQALAHVDATMTAVGSRPFWITEASRNDRPSVAPPTQYAQEYALFLEHMRARPSVRGVTYFVASASNSYFHPECWVVNGQSKGIAAQVRQLVN